MKRAPENWLDGGEDTGLFKNLPDAFKARDLFRTFGKVSMTVYQAEDIILVCDNLDPRLVDLRDWGMNPQEVI